MQPQGGPPPVTQPDLENRIFTMVDQPRRSRRPAPVPKSGLGKIGPVTGHPGSLCIVRAKASTAISACSAEIGMGGRIFNMFIARPIRFISTP